MRGLIPYKRPEPRLNDLASRAAMLVFGGLFVAGGFWFVAFPSVARYACWGLGGLMLVLAVLPKR